MAEALFLLAQEARPARSNTNIVTVVKDYGRRLFAFIRGRVSTDEDAEDILQDVWYQLSNMAEGETIDQISGWLHRVARNKITDRYRKKKEDHLDDYAREDEDGATTTLADLLPDLSGTSPETAELRRMFWQQLTDALDELPTAQRTVFIQNELEEKTLREIAEASGENLKTIISRKGYAVKHLRARLRALHDELLF